MLPQKSENGAAIDRVIAGYELFANQKRRKAWRCYFSRVLENRLGALALTLLLLAASSSGAQSIGRERHVDVKAADYALILPDTIKAGTNRWTLTNAGLIRHELIIVKLASNVVAKAAVDSLHARGMRAFFPGDPQFGIASAALLAGPGKRSEAELLTSDHRGDVLLVFCQLRDGEGKPKHDELGMFKVVQVR